MNHGEVKQFVSDLLLFMEVGDHAMAVISLSNLRNLNQRDWFIVKDEFLKNAQTWGLLGGAATIVKASAQDDPSAYSRLIPGLTDYLHTSRCKNENQRRTV